MDPLSQATLGSLAAQCGAKKKTMVLATVCGALGGMAPDLDILIRSASDPLLSLEYHRHFTHALPFIPVGGFIIALLIWLILYRKERFWLIYLFTTLGYATHGLLDAMTSYGTYLFFPFSDARISWDMISIIDPLFTLPILLLVVFAKLKRQKRLTYYAVVYMCAYFGLCFYQHQYAVQVMEDLAKSRGHQITEATVKTSFANIILWRTIYQSDGYYYVDAVRVVPFAEPIIYEGESIRVMNIERDFNFLAKDSTQYQDVFRFQRFSQNYVIPMHGKEYTYGDLRYGILPNSIRPLWGIRLDPGTPNQHVDFVSFRNAQDREVGQFYAMLMGTAEGQDYACIQQNSQC